MLELRSRWLLFLIVLICGKAWAGQWVALGPDGGDARSLAYDLHDPDHILLGTSAGTIFQSRDGGHSWAHFAHLGTGDDYVVDHIVVDPRNSQHIYAGAWSLKGHNAGELFSSFDGGRSWKAIPEMHRKSIRAVAVAASDPNVLVVGALDGIFRSTNGGREWHKISRHHSEIKNVESIAIDPENANVIYAGTWHLGWKTSDGGVSWRRIEGGIIDDSDIFSIIVDESRPQTVLASACSGIYKSLDGGRRFERILEIPFSARRTRVLKQDPKDPAVIYAGTTEGLWVTNDGGTTWKRFTGPDIVVNDILIDPRDPQRVLLATDRAGVLASEHGPLNFAASNSGFTHRYTSSILADQGNPDLLYVGVVNDRERGGVFASNDAGQNWTQKSEGLDGRDVFVLRQAGDGTVLAGTNRGIFVLPRNRSAWSPLNRRVEADRQTALGNHAIAPSGIASKKVNDIEITPRRWYAATSSGLYLSSDQGESWNRVGALGRPYIVSVEVWRNVIVVATTSKVLVSLDHTKTWRVSTGFPAYVSGIQGMTIAPDGTIIIASRKGAFRSRSLGARWDRMHLGLPSANITSVTYDEAQQRLLATVAEKTVIFESNDGGHSWHGISDTEYPLRRLSLLHGRLVATTRFDGLILQQETDQHSRISAVKPSNP
ncbi:MAG TPA: transcriptional regulator [Terriglobales bacterium]|nr:transcriptional regulator [Terriglobales bacterium]